MPCPAPTHLRLPNSNRCIGFMAIWSSFQKSVVSASLASRVVNNKHHGLGAAIWASSLTWKITDFQCHNMSLVTAINMGSAKDSTVMYLFCCLWFFTSLFDINIKVTHIAGINNDAADMLPRNQIKRFLMAHTHGFKIPTLLPATLTSLIIPQQLDWTSPSFWLHFQEVVSTIQISSMHTTHYT